MLSLYIHYFYFWQCMCTIHEWVYDFLTFLACCTTWNEISKRLSYESTIFESHPTKISVSHRYRHVWTVCVTDILYMCVVHITVGGSICMQMLTRSGWSPSNDIEVCIHVVVVIWAWEASMYVRQPKGYIYMPNTTQGQGWRHKYQAKPKCPDMHNNIEASQQEHRQHCTVKHTQNTYCGGQFTTTQSSYF